MTTVAEWYKIDGEDPAQSLNAVCEKVSSLEGEAVLDFSLVKRLDTRALGTIEELVAAAEGMNVKLELRGVNVTVYKVLKLARLSHRFVHH